MIAHQPCRTSRNVPSRIGGGVTILLCLMLSWPAYANEIWLTPENIPPLKDVGNWTVANTKKLFFNKVHFSLHVPDNMDEFTSATLVLIPKKSETIKYDVRISSALEGWDDSVIEPEAVVILRPRQPILLKIQ